MNDLDSHLDGIIAGDPHAFSLWVAGVEPRLRGRLRSFAAHVDTEAVMQETLLRIWQTAGRFEPDGKPDGLLRLAMRIARHLALDEVRKKRPDRVTAAMLEENAIDNREDGSLEIDEHIRACLAKLPPKPLAAINARIHGGWRRDDDLADRVGMTLNTFFQNVSRARAALAECLRGLGVNLGGAR